MSDIELVVPCDICECDREREPTVEELVQGLRQRINAIEDHHVDAIYTLLGAWLLGHPEYDMTSERVVSDG
jgi:hypothetical protein